MDTYTVPKRQVLQRHRKCWHSRQSGITASCNPFPDPWINEQRSARIGAKTTIPPKSQFKKGTSGNPTGRPKGTPNKINERIRETIHAALDETSPDVVGWIRRLGKDDPKGALQVYAALAEFALPKLSRQEVKAETDAKVKHTITFTRGGKVITPRQEFREG